VEGRDLRPLISIIMPALNEVGCIEDVVSSVPVKEFAERGFDTEILVVDNNSQDGTGETARRAGARVVCEPRRGYGLAYRTGFKEARGSVICTLDADRSYPISILPTMVDTLLRDELDFMSTDRFAFMHNGVMSRKNRVGNALLTLVSRALFRLPFRDSQSGMWVFRRDILDRMRLNATGMALSEEIKIEAGWKLKARCAEVPIHYGYRCGRPKLRAWRDGIGNLLFLLRKRLS
jgi:glycosyltransferase involved in cell wall biosynthesis